MIVLNLSGHPLTLQQQETIQSQKGQTMTHLFEPWFHFDTKRPFVPQIQQLVSNISLSNLDWHQHQILLIPPGLAPATAVLLAHLHGRLGYFPELVHIRSNHQAKEPYEVGEIILLQQVRDEARQQRIGAVQ